MPPRRSDLAFRKVVRRHGVNLTYTQVSTSSGVTHHAKGLGVALQDAMKKQWI